MFPVNPKTVTKKELRDRIKKGFTSKVTASKDVVTIKQSWRLRGLNDVNLEIKNDIIV